MSEVPPAADEPAVLLSVSNGVATIALNRPDTHNGFNQDTAADLCSAATNIANDDTIRAVLIVAKGRVFSVGGDVGVFASTAVETLPETLESMATTYHQALSILAGLEVPVVTAVQRAAAGAALGLLYVSDIVLADEGAKFALGFGRIGLAGDGGTSWFLPRLVGARRAAELYFENRTLDAREAAAWGLITRAVPSAELRDQAARLAQKLATGPTRAYGAMRRLFWESANADLVSQLDREAETIGRIAQTADAANAFASFRARQEPQFAGR
ncbi:enoyl-CoA hydratase-related protein [Rhodococcus pyridinivorans]|uniref:enoyl-CoA hydratase/isomerase family protein n=1 Tax=Rhodococcus pyridinivorans TaxID=103816 RepID=UPI002226DE22|nr:enoyl-CoA hydratase-related protein [Rhodococcus pyridinivorans]MCW3472815.1 enoyl-CoA hydratase-related protein [Rhodococcus pyridinivorans]